MSLSGEGELLCFFCVGGMDKYFIQHHFVFPVTCVLDNTITSIILLPTIVFHGTLPLK